MALSRLKNAQEVSINRLGYSLSIADAAGVKRPLYSNGTAIKDDPDFSIALGSDGLKRKLEIEKSISDLAQLNSGLQDSKLIINKLRELKLADVNFTAYKYLMMPNEPVKKIVQNGADCALGYLVRSYCFSRVSNGTPRREKSPWRTSG